MKERYFKLNNVSGIPARWFYFSVYIILFAFLSCRSPAKQEDLLQSHVNKLSQSKCGYIDKSGKIVIEPQFAIAGTFAEGLAFVNVDGKFGYIGKDGNLAIKPQFDFADDFSEALAPVKINGKWGYIDKAGNLIIKPDFDYAWTFSDGLANVEVHGKCRLDRRKKVEALRAEIEQVMTIDQDQLFSIHLKNSR